jgi:hypothetical protein
MMWTTLYKFVVCSLVILGGGVNPHRGSPTPKATPTPQQSKERISLTIPRYNLDEALTQISKRYGVQIISQPYAKPRVNIALLNTKRKPLTFRNQSLEQVFGALARLFQYDWFKEGSVYIFKNQLAMQDAPYLVDDKIRQLAETNHDNGTFRFLSQFVNLTQQQIMSLAEQHPQFSLLYSTSPYRTQIEAYQTLLPNLRERLDAGKKVQWRELPESTTKTFAEIILTRHSKATPKQIASTTFWLARNQQGWEQLLFSGLLLPTGSKAPQNVSKRKR